MTKTITLPNVWLKDWREIKKHIMLSDTSNLSEIYSLNSDLIVMAVLMATYRAQEMQSIMKINACEKSW